MTEQDTPNDGADKPPIHQDKPRVMPNFLATRDDARRFGGRVMLVSGIAMIAMGGLAFFYMMTGIMSGVFKAPTITGADGQNLLRVLLIHYPNLLFPTFIGSISILTGIYLMSMSLSTSSRTIPDEDRALLEDLIRSDDKKGIDQYIKLSALLGSSGFFTKLGFTGLPLATVALTLVLVTLSLVQAPEGEAVEPNLLDMAKLTLGAFLGSFVQRKIGAEATSGGG